MSLSTSMRTENPLPRIATVEDNTRRANASLTQRRRARTCYTARPVMRVIAIIPAAGLGTRMMAGAAEAAGRASKRPAAAKQFTEIDGVPILIHTLRRFVAADSVDEIYLALRPSESRSF